MTMNPELMDRQAFLEWPNRETASIEFPDFMRDLLYNTPGITNIRVGRVSEHGFDASATVKDCKFLPDGELGFEFSVDSRPKEKAQVDYDKRRENPEAKNSIFVYATPRKWSNAKSWADERKWEGNFKGVVALDGHFLFEWLQMLPPLHLSFSEEHGYHSSDIQTLTGWWNTFQNRLRVAIPPGFFLAGREAAKQKLIALIDQGPKTGMIPTVLGQTEEEALTFLFAALSEVEVLLEKTVVVSTEEAFQTLLNTGIELIAIPVFANKLGVLGRSGSVLVIQAKAVSTILDPDFVVTLPALDTASGMQELQKLNNPDVNPRYLAELARRAFFYFLIEVSRDPILPKLSWAGNIRDVRLVARLYLLGSWIPESQDEYVVELVTGRSYEEVEEIIDKIGTSRDTPFVKIGNAVHLAHSTALVKFLANEIQKIPSKDYFGALKKVLFSENAFEAGFYGEGFSPRSERNDGRYSRVLQDGLANNLPLLAVALGSVDSGELEQVIHKLLYDVFSDESLRLLLRVSHYFPQFAEAAPNVFLSALIGGSEINNALFYSSFKEEIDVYSDFLSALEVLTWSADHLSLGVHLLVNLLKHNLPQKVKSEVLRVLYRPLVIVLPFGAANTSEKMSILSRVLTRLDDDTGWSILVLLLEIDRGDLIFPQRPKFQAWPVPSYVKIDNNFHAAQDFLLAKAIEYADNAQGRWPKLLQIMPRLSPDRATELMNALDRFSRTTTEAGSDNFHAWYLLEEYIRRQSGKPGSSSQVINRAKDVASNLLSSTDPRRHALLFDASPTECFTDVKPHEAREQMDMRRRAVLGSLLSKGQGKVAAVARVVQNPHALGIYLADFGSAVTAEYMPWIMSEELALRSVAETFIRFSLSRHGPAWLGESPGAFKAITPQMLGKIAKIAPPTKQIWRYLSQAGDEFSTIFWQTPQDALIQDEDRAEAVQILFERGQLLRAIKLMVWMLDNNQEIDLETCKTVLTNLSSQITSLYVESRVAYPVSRMLKHLEEQLPDDADVIHLEFQFYRLLTLHPQNDALFTYLSENPEALAELIDKSSNNQRGERTRDELHTHFTLEQVCMHWPDPPYAYQGAIKGRGGLYGWVDRVLSFFSSSDAKQYSEMLVGYILASNSNDENWPPTELCEVVENIASSALEGGLYGRLSSDYTIHTTSPQTRGAPERVLAKKFFNIANECGAHSGRMKKVLRKLAVEFERVAKDKDIEVDVMLSTI